MQIKPFKTIYVAHPDFLDDLCTELQDVSTVIGNLVFSPLEKKDCCFALDIWHEPVLIEFPSISAAAKILRAAGKFWYLHPIENIRRARLIEAELRKLPELHSEFPLLPSHDIGCFSLLDKNTLVYSRRRLKKSPLGYFPFIEDKKNPPNRAYLKLWEALSLLNTLPAAPDIAIDLGASPGGWTWVMQKLGATVIAVDKAPLEKTIITLPRVSFLNQSAFALEPHFFNEKINWLLCDVACYPQRTLDLAEHWIASGKVEKMILTVKLQGKTDFAILEKFRAIPGGRLIHLFWNKHEVTFFWGVSFS